ncbi:alanine racemase [Pseudarthrobacter sp. H2]|uniref:alanine racemase n=1 Tax=Pseudarthrobacter sp. H2 TaxID=3418415 RepID=UPI003CEB96D2
MTSPAEIATPAVLIDSDVLDRNIARMSTAISARGLKLRPHVKTHKVLEIAAKQLAAGAVGITVATIGEAEVFANNGVKDIFIAYPLWVNPPQAERLRRLAATTRITVGVDSPQSAAAMGMNLGDDAGKITVSVEIDSGHHRSGVHPAAAVDVARAAAQAGMNVAGVFTFPGHSYAPGVPTAAARDEDAALSQAAALLQAAGFTLTQISGGSTPTALLDEKTVATELRPGVYVFGDAQQWELSRCETNDIALTVVSTVVSHHATEPDEPGRFILDAGSKILGSDRAPWATGYGRLIDYPDARIIALSEHHATVEWPQGQKIPERGSRLRVVPNHVCLTMNLVDEVHIVSNGIITGQWAVAARGKNS